MITQRTTKTGYWRINPETGEAEWIEGSYQPPKPEIVQPEQTVGVDEVLSVTPALTQPDLTSLFKVVPLSEPTPFMAFDYETNQFVYISEEEYWKREQLHLTYPEIAPPGTPGKITPQEYIAKANQRTKELETSLRVAYPEMFDPTRSYGYREEQIPSMVVEQLGIRMAEDYEGFIKDLTARVGRYEAENILKQFGVKEDFLLAGLDVVEQEARVLQTIQAVMPEIEDIESFGNLLETDWESFFETIRIGGGSTVKRQLLELIGFAPEEINEIFMRPRLVVEIDGVRKLTDIDLTTKAAYDLDGNYIGMYNPATQEFTKASPKNVLQRTWDWVSFSSRQYWELGESALISILPEIIYPNIPMDKAERHGIDKLLSDDMVHFINETNRQQRENWRFAYRENKREYEDWLGKNPQIQPSVQYQKGAFKNPELLKDPMYYVYEFANILPLVLATATIGVGTGGTGLPFFAISTGMMGAVEAGGVLQELLDAGVPEDKAARLALVAGGIIGALESVGRIPLLKQISPLVFGQFKREAAKELARQGLALTIKKFGRNFTISMFSETLTEVAQEIVGNVAVKVYDKNRSIFENVPDIAVKTAVGMAGFGLFGAGVSTRMVTPSELRGLSDAAKRAKGWVADNKGNWYEKVKEVIAEERGALELPGKPEEIKPEVTPPEAPVKGVTPPEVGKVPITPEVEGLPRAFIEATKSDIARMEEQLGRQKLIVEKARKTFEEIIPPELKLQMPKTGQEKLETLVDIESVTPQMVKAVEKLRDELRVLVDLKNAKVGVEEFLAKVKAYKIPAKITPAPEVAKEALEKAIPKAEVGMPAVPRALAGEPEAGYQPAMIEGVPEKEVRPAGKGRIVQISMEDQLKLEQARKATEEAPEELQEAYEAQAQIETIKAVHETDPVAQWRTTETVKRKTKQPDGSYKLTQYQRKTGLDSFIPIGLTEFPDTLTVKQARMIWPGADYSRWTQEGTKQYNKVPLDVPLDPIASELGFTGTTAVNDLVARINQIRKERRQLKEYQDTIRQQMTETPLPAVPELTPEEVAENRATLGQPKLTLKQAEALALAMTEYLETGADVSAYELQRALWSKTRAERSEQFKARMQELIVGQGMDVEKASKQAIPEAFSGKLPAVLTKYFERIAEEMREAFFSMVFHNKQLQEYPLEMVSTITALTNALTGKPIPRVRGIGSILFPEGGSAWDRLNLVFGKQPKILKGIEKMAQEGKTIRNVVEEANFQIIPEGGIPPIPIDQEMADYLRNLPQSPRDQIELAQKEGILTFKEAEDLTNQISDLKVDDQRSIVERIIEMRRKGLLQPPPITQHEAPIDGAVKQMPMFPRPLMDNLILVLKEIGMSPVDIGNFLRANKASVDFSFWRQQAPLIAGHPIAFAHANIVAWKALWSQKSAEASWARITRDPIYQIYEEAERQGADFLRPLEIKKGTGQYRGTEEFGYYKGVERLLPKLTAKIPWIKLSARAFETGTNEHNWLIFKTHYQAMLRLSEKYASGELTLKVGEVFDVTKEMVDFAKLLSDFTGRGSLGKFRIAAPELSGLIFAPRLAVARLVSPRHLISANPRVRAEAWKDAALFVSTVGGVVLLGAYAGWWEVERDPRSAEYMSIRIGNTRIDPWGGYRQFVVFFARAFTQTGVSSVTGAEYKVDPINLIQTFIRGKASPLASLILDVWRGKNFVGEEVDVANKKQWAERVAPFAVWDIYEAFKDDPMIALFSAVPAVVGAGVQTYTGDWAENWKKMGLSKYSDNLMFGITEPRYDTADFWTDTSSQFTGVDPATLTAKKGYPEYIKAIAEARLIKEHLDTLPSDRLASLNADPVKGLTFADYYSQWGEREKLVSLGDNAVLTRNELQPDGSYKEVTYKGDDALKIFDQDERTRNANLGNFSQRQFALLNDYWLITDPKKQAEFLEEHKAEIGGNARDEYLRTHPKENAQLAVWGQADILTKEAYNEFQKLITELDIPDSAIPEMTLPPETSLDTHFSYMDMVAEGTHGSWEAQLLIKQDALKAKEAGVQSYAEWKELRLSDSPIASLELKVKNRANFDKLDAFSDKDSPGYIADDKARAEAIKQFKAGNPEFVDDTRRIEAVEKGTDESPVDEKLVNAHVEYGKLIDQEGIGSSSAEAMLYRVDNPDYDAFRTDTTIWDDKALTPIDQSRIPIWRIDVKYKEQDAEYEAIKSDNESEQARLRKEYLAGNPEYRMDRRRREAYGFTNSKTGEKLPTGLVEHYVGYYEYSDKGFRRERFLVENPEFAQTMNRIAGIDLPDPAKVPSVEYDNIYDEWRDDFERFEGLGDNTSEFYIADPQTRQVEYDRMRYTTGQQTYSGVKVNNEILTGFGMAEIKREAYGKFVPGEYIDTYIEWRKIQSEGKPKDWDAETKQGYWFEDDWFLMENKEFYQNVYLKLLGNERKDFRLVPDRLVFKKYLIYVKLPHQTAKKEYRATNLDLDEWGVAKFGWTPIEEQERREGLTPLERFMEEFQERQTEIEERLAVLKLALK